MSLVHTQTPVGGQHANVVESHIKLVKQFCYNIIGKIKSEKFKALNLTQSEFILASAIHEVNNMPLFKHARYVFLTSAMLVNPMLELTVGQLDDNTIVKYFETVQPYLEIMEKLRYDTFIKYTTDKKQTYHGLTRQGKEVANVGDFVLIKDLKKHNFLKYGIIMDFSKNRTKALIRTKS